MRDRMMRFMAGRYGNDPLNQALMAVALVLILASMFWAPLYTVALLPLVWGIFRMFSRNIEKRRDEGLLFERGKGRVIHFFKSTKNLLVGTKTHRYFRCPGCKQQMRVPRGRGQVSIHCPKCGADFQKKT